MASSPSNLSELTVTCRQCGSASMERIGDREYRCTHCGAITVVSQDGTKSAPPAAASPTYLTPGINFSDPTRNVATPEEVIAANSVGEHTGRNLVLVCVALALGFLGVMHACGGDKPQRSTDSSTDSSTLPVKTVPGSTLTISPVVWSAGAKGEGGQYTGVITNHSSATVIVPTFSMALYLRGARVDTTDSTVPIRTLLPGEYEPIAFAFKSPSDDPHPEITPPTTANQATAAPVALQFNNRQLVQETGKPGYRLVGIVDNPTTTAARDIVVAVMLFDAAHGLISYGSHTVPRSLRAGERVAIEVDIPISSVNVVASYEYLVDAQPDN